MSEILSSKTKLYRCSPFINGSAYCGMLRENEHGGFGHEFAGQGPYYEAEAVDAEIGRLVERRRLLRFALDKWDGLRNAEEAMTRESCTFGQLLTQRGLAIDDLIAATRAFLAEQPVETSAEPPKPFAWYRFDERSEPPIIAYGEWPPPEPDDTAWRALYTHPHR